MKKPCCFLMRPPWRILTLLFIVCAFLCLIYALWIPGSKPTDGRHDLGQNGLWLQHGWLGDDEWFDHYRKDKTLFRSEAQIKKLRQQLEGKQIKYLYPHLCPYKQTGEIAKLDPDQTKLFLSHFTDYQVLPWVGGVFDRGSLHKKEWRATFTTSVIELLTNHPELAGIHLNIEPLTSGNPDLLLLLDELNDRMPEDKLPSIAAYPPPTRWHPFPDVHWDEAYYREIAKRVDQVVPMMYDTAIRMPKFYCHLMRNWTDQVLEWSGDTKVLLGVPAYDDANTGYHYPHVENLKHSIAGIHKALNKHKTLPANYQGIAIYCEWEMDDEEWKFLKKHFFSQ